MSSARTIWAAAQNSSAAVTTMGSLRHWTRHCWPSTPKEKMRSGAASPNGAPVSSFSLWMRNAASSHSRKLRSIARTSSTSSVRAASARSWLSGSTSSGRWRLAALVTAAWMIVAPRALCRSRFQGSGAKLLCRSIATRVRVKAESHAPGLMVVAGGVEQSGRCQVPHSLIIRVERGVPRSQGIFLCRLRQHQLAVEVGDVQHREDRMAHGVPVPPVQRRPPRSVSNSWHFLSHGPLCRAPLTL